MSEVQERKISTTLGEMKDLLINQFNDWDILPSVAQRPALLVGPSGWGKSALVQQAAHICKMACYTIMGSMIQIEHINGLPIRVDADRAKFLTLDFFRPILEATEPIVLFLDEFAQSDEDIQKAYMSIVYDKKILGKTIPSCVRIVAATNRPEDNAGADNILTPLLARVTIFNIIAKQEDWINWAVSTGVPFPAIAAAQANPDWFKDKPATIGVFQNQMSGRGLAATAYTLQHNIDRGYMSLDTPSGLNRMTQIAMGNVGPLGAKLVGFWQYAAKLPMTSDIAADPDNTPIPSEIDVQWTLLAKLATSTKPEHASGVLKYVARKGPDGKLAFRRSGLLYFFTTMVTAEENRELKDKVFQNENVVAMELLDLMDTEEFASIGKFLKLG